jgi:Cutinase
MYTPLPVAFITVFVCVYASPVPQDAQAPNRAIAAAPAASTAAQTTDASNPIGGLLADLDMIPIIGQSVTAISDVLTTVESTLATALNFDTTENSDGAAGCKDMTVIFARGTTEPGNVGLVTGPPFFDALSAMIGQNSISIQGVDYPASIEGFLEGGDAAGSQAMYVFQCLLTE